MPLTHLLTRPHHLVLTALTLPPAVSCGDDPVAPPGRPLDPPRPAAVVVTPANVELTAVGDTLHLVAEVRDQHGAVITPATLDWRSADPLVATVDTSGLVKAAGDGATSITAVIGTVLGKAIVTVVREARVVTLAPATRLLSVGDTFQLSATAADRNGNPIDATVFRWSSSDDAIATVDSSGLVRGRRAGVASITAATSTASASTRITVTSAETDRAALVALYEATDGPNWKRNDNWLSTEPLGDWYGVFVDEEGRVVGLDLAFNDLSGPIPLELGILGKLRGLALNENALLGSIPARLGDLANLQRLDLRYNRLTGPLPPALANIETLLLLRVSNNLLTGSVARVFLQSALREFHFRENAGLCAPGKMEFIAWAEAILERQTGPSYPPYEGPFCNGSDVLVLESLYERTGGEKWTSSDGWRNMVRFAWGHVTAALDQRLGVTTDSLGRVKALRLSQNNLSGRLPPDLWRLARMTELLIDGNDLRGPIPTSLTAVPLRTFHYADTGLCAPPDASFRDWLTAIPSHEGTGAECGLGDYRAPLVALFEATDGANWVRNDGWLTETPLSEWHGVTVDEAGRIVGLELDDNGLAGQVPADLGSLSHLSRLSLGGNDLDGRIPSELGDLTLLTRLALSNNGLTGLVPTTFGGLTSLRELILEENDLTGYPREIGSLSSLEILDLSGNRMRHGVFTPMIWPELGELANLRVLDLSDNRMLTPIPRELGKVSRLEVLNLSGNDLKNPIPPELGRLSSLRVLDLGHARDGMGIDYRLSGSVPPELANLTQLQVLNLSHHRFDAFPSELGDLGSLEVLALGGNRFERVPEAIRRLRNLRELSLQSNVLAGSLPTSLGEVTSLERLDVSHNGMLSGPLPYSFTMLSRLTDLRVSHTQLCAPNDASFLRWLEGTGAEEVPVCSTSGEYLTQGIRWLSFPMPPVGTEPVLRRQGPLCQHARDTRGERD